jgi:hypothetical protein
LWVVERSADFPSKHKFTLGQRWLDACLMALEALLEGAYQKDKRVALLAASRALPRAQVVARLASGVKGLSPKPLLYFEKESAEIGRMVGGWLKNLEARASGPNSLARSAQRGHGGVGSVTASSCQGMEGQAPTV